MTNSVIEQKMRIPSDRAEANDWVGHVVNLLQRRAWSENDCFAVKLAMQEAVVNAIKHGNENDHRKFVSVAYRINGTAVCIEITDEGDGFKPEELPDPTDPENLEKSNGRGVLLMRSFMTNVVFNERGNTVTMTKKRSEETVLV